MSVTYDLPTGARVMNLFRELYFPVLGCDRCGGRTFTPDDDKTPSGQPLVVFQLRLLELLLRYRPARPGARTFW